MRTLVSAIIYFWVISLAFYAGGIWDSQANPKENVTVHFDNGMAETGTLSYDWDGTAVLYAHGDEIRFTQYRAMSFIAPKHEISFWDGWRCFVPAALVASLCFVAFVGGKKKLFNGGKNETEFSA